MRMIGAVRRPQRLGLAGTVARIAVGGTMVTSVAWGHLRSGVDPAAWILGLLVFPAVTFGLHARWTRGHAGRRVALSGPVGRAITFAVFFALYLTWWYAPSVGALSDAALLFYGTTMLVAAGRSYAGCEVLAISNWALRRDDQVGCLLFEPIDQAERWATSRAGRTTTR